MKKYFTPKIILFALLFLFLISLRFVYLDAIPAGLAHDEVIYSLNRQTILENGTDSGGVSLPLAFFRTMTEGNISILPVLLNTPLQMIAPADQFFARLPYVLVNILTAFALFLFTYYLLKNKTIALLAALLFLINPWSFFLSRFATDSPFALLFFLLGLAFTLRLRGWALCIPFLFFVLGFFSYHGAKIAFLPVIIILIVFLIKGKFHPIISKKEAGFFLSAIVVLCLLFFVVNALLPDSIISERKGELFFLNTEKITETVNIQRALTIDNPFSGLAINKFMYIAHFFAERYLTAFSPGVLFLTGDTRIIYSYSYHGLFYFFDAIFILTGLVFLWLKERKKALFLLSLILVAPLASAVSGIEFSYIHRSFLLLPLFIVLSATGLYTIYKYLSRRLHKALVIFILFCVILFPTLYFFHFYFYRYSITNGEHFAIDERVLAKFVKESESAGKPLFNIVDSSEDVYFTSLYYNNDKAAFNDYIKTINTVSGENHTYYKNTFGNECPRYTKEIVLIAQWTKNCKYTALPQYVIRNPKDGGIFYKIYNSTLCDGVNVSKWRRFNTMDDYAIEKMDRKKFCERWISLP